MPYLPDEFSFRLVSGLYGDKQCTFARFDCSGCPAHHEQPVRAGKILNAEHIAKRAARDGWQVSARRGGKVFCPACLQAAKRAAKGDSGAKVITLPMPPIIHDTQQKELLPMASVPPSKPAAKGPAQTELTVEQRFKVRQILDKTFDDQAGCYLDNYSDQRIGEELKVPWSLVARVRETAYGPIRVDPEITALRNMITDFERKLKDHEEAWKRASASAAAEINDLKARLVAVEKRRGVAA